VEALAGFFFEFWFLKNILHTNFVELHRGPQNWTKSGCSQLFYGLRILKTNIEKNIFLRFLIKNLFI